MISWEYSTFDNLSARKLYEILALRQQVFNVEQQCAYLDADGLDPSALHIMGYQDKKLVCYLRLFEPLNFQDKEAKFGRVVTATTVRKQGLGKQLIQQVLTYLEQHHPNIPIHISAQTYLQRFYENFGFQADGEPYLEDHIPHITMVKK